MCIIKYLIFVLCLNVSAYTIPKDEVSAKYSVVINASIEDVWKYNANNENARDWSIYFYKIKQCPTAHCPWNKDLKSSDIGFTRRCYRNADESGIFWDETTTIVNKEPGKYYKQIRAFNFSGYSALLFFNKKGEYVVEQFYEKLGPNRTRLSFRSGLVKREELEHDVGKFQYGLWNFFMKAFTKKETQRIFKLNLENIKHAIEQGDKYQRIHPYMN